VPYGIARRATKTVDQQPRRSLESTSCGPNEPGERESERLEARPKTPGRRTKGGSPMSAAWREDAEDPRGAPQ
jgi:hypothetical protein